MAIFLKKASLVHEAKNMFIEAYSTNPPLKDETLRLSQSKAEELEKNTTGQYTVLKIVLAFALVLFIFILAYFSGQNDKLTAMYDILLHSGEICLGGLIGILIGEAGK